ncbi:MerR family transcriptional regulator [Bifidobacterium vespertilionis]|uniref:MerR family transcriptional regulator n=2 Tax=Bifidobacterium vespertilionis TaxID=2562524 RepID=A0A5J5DWE5_9BIFI|nr:MerR family transcriptional regulator [Bifidobacterium vespertilionis]KAA8823675.1 MerR family transcriptional regulator [Bifidobacterium vespertilionis]
MKETCARTGMNYEALKFYCNEGLVPNLQRDEHNHRVFTEHDIAWLQGLGYLRRCGMGISEMKRYMQLCMAGPSSIPERKRMLGVKREALLAKLAEVNETIAYIDDKQRLYDDILAGRAEYHSNLFPTTVQPIGHGQRKNWNGLVIASSKQ